MHIYIYIIYIYIYIYITCILTMIKVIAQKATAILQ